MCAVDVDLNARETIVNDLDANIFVQASAGSGKTTSLVNRLVAMIESGIDVTEICTITFTKNAAAEFFERFQKLLSERSRLQEKGSHHPGDLGEQNEITMERCRVALQSIDLCFMGTIDSFTNLIVSEHPNEVKIPQGTVVATNEEMQEEYKQIYVECLKGLYGEKIAAKLSDLKQIDRNYTEAFIKGLAIVMDHKDFKLAYTPVTETLIDIKNNAFETIELMELLLNNPTDVYKIDTKEYIYLQDNFEDIKKKPWNKVFLKVKRAIKNLKAIKLVKNPVNEKLASFYNDLAKPTSKSREVKVETYIDPIMKKLDDYYYNSLMSVLDEVRPIAAAHLRKRGVLSFNDYLLYLHDTLKEDAKNGGVLTNYITRKHKYFLIDESQDTSPIQTELFFYLAAKTPNPDWKKCEPRKGSLFIVGDDKQSIYGFRGADVSSYKDIMNHFGTLDNCKVLQLQRNFRSSVRVRKYFNAVMNHVLDGVTIHPDIPIDTHEKAIKKENAENKATFNGIFKYDIEIGKSSYDDNVYFENAADGEMVSNIILSTINNPKYTICAKADDKDRTIKFKDFMVITWNKSMTDYLECFRKYKIPFIVEGMVMFENSIALNQIKAIFRAISIPNNVEYVYNALKSEYFGLSESDLIKLHNEGFKFNLFQEFTSKEVNSNNAINKLRDIYEKTEHMSFTAKLDYINNFANIYTKFTNETLEYAYYAIELLRQAENECTVVTPIDAVKFIDAITSDNKDYERALSLSKDNNKVHIANLHKVKGLQAPICILAGKYYKNNASISLSRANSELDIFRIESDDSFHTAIVSTKQFSDAEDKQRVAASEEEARLQYVAATRAEATLIIANPVKSEKIITKPWYPLIEGSNRPKTIKIVNNLNDATNEDDVFVIEGAIKVADTPVEEEKDLQLEKETKEDTIVMEDSKKYELPTWSKSSYDIVRPSKLAVSRVDKEDNENPDDAIKPTEPHFDAALLGTMIHKMMEILVNCKNNCNKANLLRVIQNQYGSYRYDSILSKVYDTIESGGFTQSDGSESDILKVLLNADEVMCEAPFAYFEDNKLYNGTIDVIYRYGDKWYIVDYKTNYEDDIISLTNHYKEQLDSYVKAFKKTTGLDATARIYHINAK